MCPKNKSLQDMSLSELWELFPVVLTPHRPQWTKQAKHEIAILSNILAEFDPEINHIGSTAIPDICAKPIIDILVEIARDFDRFKVKSILENYGYICMSESETRMSFNKGYTPAGFSDEVFHVHVRETGDNDEIFFRDYLASDPETAREYEKLKLSLLPEYEHDRDGYTTAKSEFVKRITTLAKQAKQ